MNSDFFGEAPLKASKMRVEIFSTLSIIPGCWHFRVAWVVALIISFGVGIEKSDQRVSTMAKVLVSRSESFLEFWTIEIISLVYVLETCFLASSCRSCCWVGRGASHESPKSSTFWVLNWAKGSFFACGIYGPNFCVVGCRFWVSGPGLCDLSFWDWIRVSFRGSDRAHSSIFSYWFNCFYSSKSLLMILSINISRFGSSLCHFFSLTSISIEL